MTETKEQLSKWRKSIREFWAINNPYNNIVKKAPCSRCRKKRLTKFFARNNSAKNGLQSWCNSCRKQKATEDPRKQLLVNARMRSRRLKIKFNLALEDIVIPLLCPVLGIAIKTGNTKQSKNSPSIDRVNSKLGYIKNNIRVISWRANDLKKDASIEELEQVLNYVKNSTDF